MALKAEGSREGGSDEDVCLICFEASPPPIQSGCACRGSAGGARARSPWPLSWAIHRPHNLTPGGQITI